MFVLQQHNLETSRDVVLLVDASAMSWSPFKKKPEDKNK